MFIVPGFYPPRLGRVLLESHIQLDPGPGAVSVSPRPPPVIACCRIHCHPQCLLSPAVTAALRGKFAIELQCEDCQPDPEICLSSVRIARCSVSLCFSVTWDAQVNKDYASKNFEFPHSWNLNFPNEPLVDWNTFADNIVTFQTWHSMRDTVINISGIVQLIRTCCVGRGH